MDICLGSFCSSRQHARVPHTMARIICSKTKKKSQYSRLRSPSPIMALACTYIGHRIRLTYAVAYIGTGKSHIQKYLRNTIAPFLLCNAQKYSPNRNFLVWCNWHGILRLYQHCTLFVSCCFTDIASFVG